MSGTGDDTVIVVGARYQDFDASHAGASTSNAGAAYVFTRTGMTWGQEQKLVADQPVSSGPPSV